MNEIVLGVLCAIGGAVAGWDGHRAYLRLLARRRQSKALRNLLARKAGKNSPDV